MTETHAAISKAPRRRRLRLIALGATLTVALGVWVVAVPFPRQELTHQPVTSTVIVDRHGALLREVLSAQQGRGRWLEYGRISPNLVLATVHAEDKRFFEHPGVDGIALLRSIAINVRRMKLVTGASTLTQQTVKLVHGRHGRDLWAKLAEVVWAVRLERTLSKNEILEQYLNRAPYGNQLFGVEAAARMYLGKSAHQLSLAEAALLAGLPQAPTALDPYRHPAAARARARWILDRMRERGAITEERHRHAVAERPNLRPRRAPMRAPHFTEHVLGSLPEGHRGEIRTTLNLETQSMVEGVVRAELSRLRDRNVSQAAVVVVDTRSAEVLAWVGSRDYWDQGAQGANDGVLALRQPGSALKPFVYGLYLEEGGTAADMIADLPTHFPSPDGVYVPQNYSRRFSGPVSVREALASSLNVPAVKVASEVGVEDLLARLKLAGLNSLELPPDHYGLGLVLGDGEVRLADLTAAYAGLGRMGMWRPLRLVLESGSPAGPSRRVFERDVAYILMDILSDDRARRIGFGESGPLSLPYKMAAKTGTSTDFRDNWALGVTPDFTVGVWVGNFDGAPMTRVSGATGAAPILRQVFQGLYPRAATAAGVKWFPRPSGIRAHRVCALSGSPVGPHCVHGRTELFSRGQRGASAARGSGDLRGPGPPVCPIHRAVAIDRRNGLRATATCDSSDIREEVFDLVPAAWLQWAMESGLRLAPVAVSPLCPPPTPPDPAEPFTIEIVRPLPGDRFAIDPSVAAESQRASLQAVVQPRVPSLTWFVDGESVGEVGPPYTTTWRLRPGTHRVGVGRGRVEAARVVVVEALSATATAR